ncbi:MAG: hypothetical protein FD180_5070 [Planctomycetota bacterium]|nr:MAG: hypothetical protein FD180_5070 [Planctomycetota bacterium]
MPPLPALTSSPPLLAASGVSGLPFVGFVLLILLCVACAVAVILFFIAPLIVLVTHRQTSSPEILPHDPGPFPTPADEFFNDLGPRLADLGFAETQRWSFRGFATNIAAELCTMADRRRRVLALGTVMHVRRKGVYRLHSRFLEYSSRTEDGRTLVTTNAPTPMLFTDMGARRIIQLPSLLDPAALLQAHERLVARETSAKPSQEPPTRDEFPGRLRDALAASHNWQVARGLLAPAQAGKHRLTLKGAFLYTWTALPPGKQMLRRRRSVAEARLIRDLGLPSSASSG